MQSGVPTPQACSRHFSHVGCPPGDSFSTQKYTSDEYCTWSQGPEWDGHAAGTHVSHKASGAAGAQSLLMAVLNHAATVGRAQPVIPAFTCVPTSHLHYTFTILVSALPPVAVTTRPFVWLLATARPCHPGTSNELHARNIHILTYLLMFPLVFCGQTRTAGDYAKSPASLEGVRSSCPLQDVPVRFEQRPV